MREYIRLMRFVRPYRAKFILAVVCMAFSAIFDGASLGMIVPLADKVLTNKRIIIPTRLPPALASWIERINQSSRLALLNYMAIGVCLLFLLKWLFGFLQSYLMSDIGQRVVRDIKDKLYSKFHQLSLDFFTKKRGGELVSRITNDVKLVENAVSYGSTDLVYQSFQVIIFLSLTFFIYFKLALVSLILVPLISFPIVKVGRALRKLSRKSQEKMADINSLLYEAILGARIIKAFNMEEYEIGKFKGVNQNYYRLTMKSIKRTLLLSPATEFIGALAGVFVFVWAGREVIAEKLSFGVFGLFLGSLLSLIRPFKKLAQVNSLNQQAVAASVRIYEILDTTSLVVEKKDAFDIDSFNEGIVFDSVCFRYAEQEVLKEINLEIKKGEVLGIVGPSGSGKTTLVDLIPRFYDPTKGRVLIDGMNIREMNIKALRRLIGIVSQETILFNDTVRANIAYGDPSADDKEIEEAASQAYAQEFIKKLPSGYNTIIGERGTRLSGGERQRLAIARALLKNPPILILDEATSQLDTQSEGIVQEALNRLMQGRTVFIIAHRLSTVRNAHKIIVLDNGRIVEEGSHQQLFTHNGLYKRLYQVQMESAEARCGTV